jgi:hypothetical protein
LCWRRYKPFGFSTRVPQHPRSFLSLLLVSRLIYQETHLLPFTLNTFRFKSQEAFTPWFSRFTSEQLASLRSVELVTWMGHHMAEGESWPPKRVQECFPIELLGGLKRVVVEVQLNGRERDCVRDEGWKCEGFGLSIVEEERVMEEWFAREREGIKVEFVRVAA